MSIRELLEYIADAYTIEDVLYILGKDYTWLLYQIKEELLEHREDFISGDEYYTEINE
jgi:hypothetical protein